MVRDEGDSAAMTSNFRTLDLTLLPAVPMPCLHQRDVSILWGSRITANVLGPVRRLTRKCSRQAGGGRTSVRAV